jgi:hypothetical protein
MSKQHDNLIDEAVDDVKLHIRILWEAHESGLSLADWIKSLDKRIAVDWRKVTDSPVPTLAELRKHSGGHGSIVRGVCIARPFLSSRS